MPTTPSFLHGWPFLAVAENANDDALPIRGTAHDIGPVIETNPLYVSGADLEDWSIVAPWLCPPPLAESLQAPNGIGRFTSRRWRAFRKESARQTSMGWREILASTPRRGGLHRDHLTACLLMDSRLNDRLSGQAI